MELKQSQAVGMKDLIATLVVSGILMIVGVFVFAKVKDSMSLYDSTVNATQSQAYNATVTIESTVYDAFTLSVVALIVLAAAVIIGILVRAFGA